MNHKIEILQVEVGRNNLYVQSAEIAINDLRSHLEKILNGDENAANLLVQATTQAAIDQKRVCLLSLC